MLSNKKRSKELTLAKEYLQVEPTADEDAEQTEVIPVFVCRECGDVMVVIQFISRHGAARGPPLVSETEEVIWCAHANNP